VSIPSGGYLGIYVFTMSSQSKSEHIKHLRELKHLAVVDVDLAEGSSFPEAIRDEARGIWKRELIRLLKDSPSTDRKFLRWRVVQSRPRIVAVGRAYDIVESEELEVLPETSS